MSGKLNTLETLRDEFGDIWVEEAVYPALVPRSSEDVMRAVAWGRSNGWRLFPVGRGHAFPEKHVVPSGVITLLSLSREVITDPDPRDLAIEVETGVPSRVLTDLVYDSGFRLDGWPEKYPGTVGGLICGERGIMIRHLILGVDVVDGRGNSLRFGGRVRKNVSGFDVAGLFAGSGGALGWLDRVYLRLTPKDSPPIGRVSQELRTTANGFQELSARVAGALDPDNVFLKMIA